MLEIKKKKGEKLTEGKILPKDDVTVYGTGASQFMPIGSEHTVHSYLAKKLVADGKVSMDPVEQSEIDTTDDPDNDQDSADQADDKSKKGGKANEK